MPAKNRCMKANENMGRTQGIAGGAAGDLCTSATEAATVTAKNSTNGGGQEDGVSIDCYWAYGPHS